MKRSWLLASALMTLGLPVPVLAEGLSRVAFAVDEVGLDGARDASDLEGALIERLAGEVEGLSFVHLDRTASMREAEGPLTARGRARRVEAAEADLLVLGEVRLSKAGGGGYLPGTETVEAAARLEVVATDSGEVLKALRARSVGSHFGLREAEARAVESLAKKLAPKLVSSLKPRRRFVLTLTLPESSGAAQVDAVLDCLSASSAVPPVSVQAVQPGEARLQIAGEVSPRSLARDLDGLCGLRARGYTARAVQLELRPGGLGRLVVVGQPFLRDSGLKGYGWLARALPRMVLAELAGEAYLDVREALEKGAPPAEALVVKGRYAARTRGLWVSMRLEGPGGEVWLAEQKVCPKAEAEACFVDVAHALASRTRPAVDEHRGGVAVTQAKAAGVQIKRLHLDPVFPARRGAYDARQPVGWVEIHNPTPKKISNLIVSLELGGVSDRPSETAWTALEAGATARVDLSVWLSIEKLRALRQPRTVPVTVEVRGPAGAPARRNSSAVVYAKNAVDWPRAAESVAAFIDPSDDLVGRLAAAYRAAAPKTGFAHSLGEAALAFQALAKLTYTKDAAHPFQADAIDTVGFPSEVWLAGGGDCDDLSVLYASLLEALGHETALLVMPGHVLVAVEAGYPPSAAQRLSLDPDATLAHQGKLWIPVETTQPHLGFARAWALGRDQLQTLRRSGATPKVVTTRSSWARFPPAELSSAQPSNSTPVSFDAGAARAALEARESERRTQLKAQVARWTENKDEVALNRAGVLLALSDRRAEAKRALEQSLAVHPTAASHNNLGNLAFIDHKVEAAARSYDAALALEPRSMAALLNAVLANYELSRDTPSRQRVLTEILDRALDVDPVALGRFLESLPGGGATPAARGGSRWSGLVSLLRTRLHRSAPGTVGQRAGIDLPVDRLLRWMR